MPGKHKKDRTRDGDFVRDFSRLVGMQDHWAAGQALVGRQPFDLAPSQAFDFSHPPSTPYGISLPASKQPLTMNGMEKMIRRAGPGAFSDKPRTPAAWRDLTDDVKAIFYHFAIRMLGTSYRFDLNLSDDVAATSVRQGPRACEFLKRKISKALKEAVGVHVELVLVLEEDDDRRLHIHGTMVMPEDLRVVARQALMRAGGDWTSGGGQFQVNMTPQQKDPDLRGGTYISKNVRWAAAGMRKSLANTPMEKLLPNFQGRALSATREVQHNAQKLYAEACALVIRYREKQSISRAQIPV